MRGEHRFVADELHEAATVARRRLPRALLEANQCCGLCLCVGGQCPRCGAHEIDKPDGSHDVAVEQLSDNVLDAVTELYERVVDDRWQRAPCGPSQFVVLRQLELRRSRRAVVDDRVGEQRPSRLGNLLCRCAENPRKCERSFAAERLDRELRQHEVLDRRVGDGRLIGIAHGESKRRP